MTDRSILAAPALDHPAAGGHPAARHADRARSR